MAPQVWGTSITSTNRGSLYLDPLYMQCCAMISSLMLLFFDKGAVHLQGHRTLE